MANPLPKEYIEDEKRNQVRCRFYELKKISGVRQAPIYAICTLEEADFKIEKGVPVERTEKERRIKEHRKKIQISNFIRKKL